MRPKRQEIAHSASSIHEEEVTVALRFSLLSSIILFLGSSLLGTYVVLKRDAYDIDGDEWDDNNTLLPGIVVSAGWALIALHTVPEFIIDLPPLRPYTHSRYARTRFKHESNAGLDYSVLNRVQSILFGLAAVLEVAAYICLFRRAYLDDDVRKSLYYTLNLVAALFWLLAAALLLVTRGCCWLRCCLTFRDTCDQTGNGIFIVATVLWMFAALTQYENFNESFLENIIQDFCMMSWLVCSIFYLLADLQRISCYRPTRKPSLEGSNVDHTPLTTINSNGSMFHESELKRKVHMHRNNSSSTGGSNDASQLEAADTVKAKSQDQEQDLPQITFPTQEMRKIQSAFV